MQQRRKDDLSQRRPSETLTGEAFMDVMSIHLAFQVLIRVGIVLATGIGLLAMLTGPLMSSVEPRKRG